MRAILAAILLYTALAVAPAPATEIRLAVTDLVGLEELRREFGAFTEVLAQATGHQIAFFPVASRIAAATALQAKQVDFVLTGPAEYVVLKKKTDAYPVVGFSRPDYFGVLVALADGPVRTLADLRGGKVAVGSFGSTSKHLAPCQIIKDAGIDPLKELELVHTQYPVAWEALKRGEILALGITNDKFLKMREKEAEAGMPPGSFLVIGRGPDLPNDLLLAGRHVDSALVETVRSAFTSHSDALIAAILKGEDNQKFQGMKFLASIRDEDYHPIRAMYATIGYPQYAEFIGE